MQRRKSTLTATFSGLVLTGMMAVAIPSYAADSAPAAPPASVAAQAKDPQHASRHAKGPKGDGAKRLCRRVPKLERRIERRIKRMEGTVGTPGSIKFLEQRIANAKKAHHSAIATFLGDRLTTRKTLLTSLKAKQPDLKDVATWCTANENGAKATASPTS
ncbi:hypothetical protein ACFW1M_38160 [Streptomyces inhibens]|uniref:hypothetical protein n=1 Tax=Streptomyces inhibens TaxID=2293571 RepID=UPI0036C33011